MATTLRRFGFTVPLVFVLAACNGELSTLDPAGPQAASVARLWWVMLAGAALIFAFVMALFLIALFARRQPSTPSERLWLLGGGIIFPGIVLTALLVYALLQGERLLPRGLDPSVLTVHATSRQWNWSFRVEGQEAASSDRLIIPVGREVDIRVTSEDVIHSFWVPRLGGKIDAVPGHINVIRLKADKPGIYRGQCAEYCGTGHAVMFFNVEALDEAAYAARLAEVTP